MEENEKLNNSLNRIVKTSTVVFLGIIFSKFFSYAYRILIARYFGPEVYGLLILGTITIAWLISLSTFGLIDGLLRFVSFYRGKDEKNKIRYLFKFSRKIFLILSISFSIFLFLFSKYLSINIMHNPNLEIFLKIFSFLIPFAVFGNAYLSIIKAYEKIKWHTFILNFAENISKVLFLILFIFIGLKKEAVIFSYFLGVFTTFLFSYYVCRFKIKGLFKKFKLSKKEKNIERKKIFHYSIPLLFSGVIYALVYGADSFLIGYFKSVTQTGIYNAAVPIVSLMSILPGVFIILFFPLVNKEYSRNNLFLIRELSKQVGKWIFFSVFPIFVLMILFPEIILDILFGREYLGATTVLRILSFGVLFSCIFSVSGQLILVKGKSKLIFLNLFLMFFLNLLLNVILIPLPKIIFIDNSSGINGAAIATMISSIFLSFLYMFQAKHYFSIIPIKKQMIKFIFISIIPIILILILKQIILINLISFGLLSLFYLLFYLLSILLFNGLDENDIKIIKSIKNKFLKR